MSDVDAIIEKAIVCRLAMSDNDQPYIVPLSFGYDGKNLYFHGKSAGKKIDILKKNNKVSFECDINVALVPSDKPCKWDVRYKSVVGSGVASFVNDFAEKKGALEYILKQYSSKSFTLVDEVVTKTTVIKVEIKEIQSKVSDPD